MSDVPWKSLKNGFAIPVLGQGTWRMGGVDTPDTANDDADIAAIRRGIATGLCHIDTAEMYAGGHAEELVGIAMKGQGIRRADYFLTDKVWKTHLRYDDVLRAAEASLKRLGTDYIDLYLIHQVNPDVPEEETIRAMNRLKREGVIRHIGVSNFSEERLKRAQAASDAPIVANQLHYNLRIREIEQSGLLDYCRSQDIMVIAWRPLRGLDLALPLIVNSGGKIRKNSIADRLELAVVSGECGDHNQSCQSAPPRRKYGCAGLGAGKRRCETSPPGISCRSSFRCSSADLIRTEQRAGGSLPNPPCPISI